MDEDGIRYLRQLRQSARMGWLTGWMPLFFEEGMPYGASGYVWFENHRLIGNLSLFPFSVKGRQCWLVANVAVHPDYRGRGIATQLTRQALEAAGNQGIASVWLQVRIDNLPAFHLYQKLGFEEKTRRTTWIAASGALPQLQNGDYVLEKRQSSGWTEQKAWLERLYPAEYAWHLPVRWVLLQPGLPGAINRFLEFSYPRHWTVRSAAGLLGVLTWMPSSGYRDHLLLAAPSAIDEQAILALLIYSRRQLPHHRKLTLNIPAGFAENPLKAAGFSVEQTLSWMEFRISTGF